MDWREFRNIPAFKNITILGTATIIGSVISALFWLYLADLLNAENYGQLAYFIGISGIVSNVVLLGGSSVITVYIAKGVKIQPPIYLISILSSIIAGIILFFVFDSIGMSVYVIGNVIYILATSELLGRKFYKSYSKYFILQKILFVGFSISLYYLIGPQGVLIGIGLSFIPLVKIIYESFKNVRIDFRLLKTKLGFMVNNYILDLTGSFKNQIDILVIAPLFGFAVLGNYYLGLQFIGILGLLPGIIFKYILPQDSSGVSTTKIKIFAVFASVILALLGVFISLFVMPIIFPEFSEIMDLVPIMSLAIIPLTINSMLASKFLALEKSRHVLIGNLVYTTMLISGIFIFVEFFDVTGLAIAFVFSACLMTCYMGGMTLYKKSI